MARNNGSIQSAQALLVSLLYAKICDEVEKQKLLIGPGGLADENASHRKPNDADEMKKLQLGPSGLADENASRRKPNDADEMQKLQIGPGGLSQGNSPDNPLPDETIKQIAVSVVEAYEFEQKAMAAFTAGQEKETEASAA